MSDPDSDIISPHFPQCRYLQSQKMSRHILCSKKSLLKYVCHYRSHIFLIQLGEFASQADPENRNESAETTFYHSSKNFKLIQLATNVSLISYRVTLFK